MLAFFGFGTSGGDDGGTANAVAPRPALEPHKTAGEVDRLAALHDKFREDPRRPLDHLRQAAKRGRGAADK